MARNQISALFIFFLCSLAASPVMAQDEPDKAEIKKQTLAQMRATAQQFEIEVNSEKAELIADPIYRYSDPAREFDDGTIWAFGNKGRPAAIVTVAQDKSDKFITETVVLSDDAFKVFLNVGGRTELNRPEKNAKFTTKIMKPVAQAKKPSGPKQRLRSQAKTLAREFQAFEMWNNDNQTEEQRYQLRLLPTPIHEYDDPEKGILSGSIFVLSYGSNPELVMVLEALKDGWRCGFGRLGHAKATVQHDDKEFYSHEWYGGRDPFYLFVPVPKPPIEANAGTAN